MKTKVLFAAFFLLLLLQVEILMPAQVNAQTTYLPTWNSLKNHSTPQWLKDGKFGIYTHWGVYAVPAQGPNATWYANNVYTDSSSDGTKIPRGHLRSAREIRV